MQLNAGLNYMSTTWGTGVQIADNSDSHVVIVLGITLIATTSVVTGLRQGLKHLSILAMVLCLIVLLTVTLADNTWYLANVFTQAIGYYAQHIIGTAFDCEASYVYGAVAEIRIPVSANEQCEVYVKWSEPAAAAKALASLTGRKFDGRLVGVTPTADAKFDAVVDGA